MNERDQARALLPPWVTWAGPVAYLVLVAVVSALAAWLAIAIGMAGYAKAAQATGPSVRDGPCRPAR